MTADLSSSLVKHLLYVVSAKCQRLTAAESATRSSKSCRVRTWDLYLEGNEGRSRLGDSGRPRSTRVTDRPPRSSRCRQLQSADARHDHAEERVVARRGLIRRNDSPVSVCRSPCRRSTRTTRRRRGADPGRQRRKAVDGRHSQRVSANSACFSSVGRCPRTQRTRIQGLAPRHTLRLLPSEDAIHSPAGGQNPWTPRECGEVTRHPLRSPRMDPS